MTEHTQTMFAAVLTILSLGVTAAAAQTPVPTGTISTDTTWTLAGSPYLVQGSVVVQGTDGPDSVTTLTIEPGVEVRFAQNAQFQIGGSAASNPGALVADGDAAGGPATILFTADSISPTPGYWYGIYLRTGATDGTFLRNVEIRYAGSGSGAGIYANQAAGVTIQVVDATILDSSSDGVRITSGILDVSSSTVQGNPNADVRIGNSSNVGGSFAGCALESVRYDGANAQPISWTGNTFTSYGAVTSRIDADDLGEFSSNSTFTKVPGAVTEVTGSQAARDATWAFAAAPYVFTATVSIAGTAGVLATVTIDPGAELRFNASTGLTVGGTGATTPGALIADGDATGGPATILFTANSGTPSPGFWRGIDTRNGMDGSTVLRNVEIRYAGASGYAGVYASHTSGTTITVDRATILDASTHGIYVLGGDLQLTDSTVRGNPSGDLRFNSTAGVGGSVSGCTLESVIYTGTSVQPISWSNNTFLDYGAITSVIDVDDLGEFVTGGTFTKVPGAVTHVLAGTAERDATWTADAAPYVMLGSVTVRGASSIPATVSIDPGVELRFNANSGLTVGGTGSTTPGALIADGDAAGGPATILFTANSGTPTPGFWRGIETRNGMDGSTVLRNVEIRYAGASGYAGVYANHTSGTTITVDRATILDSGTHGIYVLGGDLQLTDSTVRGNPSGDLRFNNTTGVSGSVSSCTLESVIYVGTSVQPISWSNNTFLDYGAITSVIDADDLGEFVTGGTFTTVPGAVTHVLGGNVTRDATWTADAAPYTVLGSLTIQGSGSIPATLTIEPGIELRFAQNTTLTIGGTGATTPGALIADGDAAGGPATIRFTADSATPTPGFWRGILTRNGMLGTTLLRNVEIRYAGGSGYAGVYANHTSGTTITVDRATIVDSGTHGIYVLGGDLQLTDSTVRGNPSGDLRFNSTTSVGGSVSGCTLESVVYDGVGAQPIAWANNTFLEYGTVTSVIDADDLGEFATSGTFAKVSGAVTHVTGGSVTRDATWTFDPAPYIVLGSLTIQGSGGVPATLTIGPGAELRFAQNTAFTIGGTGATAPGALIADGDAAGGPATIRFRANTATPTPGYWRGLQTRNGMLGTTLLRNVEIGDAGGSGYAGLYALHTAGTSIAVDRATIVDSSTDGIHVLSGDLQLTDSTLRDNATGDLRLQNSTNVSASISGSTLESVTYAGVNTQPIAWTGNTFDNWGQRTSKLRIDDLDQFTHDNTFNPVTGAVLEVFGGIVDLDAAWGAAAGPLVFDTNVSVYGTDGVDGVTTLTLDPGATIRVPPARSFTVGRANGDPGELIADGAPGGLFEGTINFSVESDVPNAGDWVGVVVDNTGRAVLRDVQVRYADTAIRVDGTLGVSSNVTVNRSNIGLLLDQATVEGVLRGWSFRNCGTGVRAASTDVTFREANLLGGTFGAENLTPASHCIDAEMNFWGAGDGPTGTAPAVGCETATPAGSGAPITEGVLFSTFLDVTPDDGDALACDDGDGFRDPCTGGNTVDCDDNCCEVANDSQGDLDGDGVGDACDSNPVLRVSSDPADGADFTIVQDAADVSIQSGTRVEILPGLGPYTESVRLDRSQVYSFVGVTNANQDPIVVDGGSGPAFRVINKIGTVPTSFRDLTFRGGQGVRASVDTEIVDAEFDGIPGEAMQLDGGVHVARRVTVGPFVGAAARVEQGASLDAHRVDVRGATDAGFDADGALTLENVLIAAGADGVRLRANGSLDATYVTVTDNTGVGIDAGAGGTVSSIDRSIVYGNALDDLVAVGCGAVTWTDSASPDCSAVGNNLSVDPVLDIDYRPSTGSPCLDHGPDPATFGGTPSTDLAGGVRIADHDGDGFAVNDCGAYETVNDTLVPGEVGGLTWDFDFRLVWDAEPDAAEYHVYRDLLSNLGYASFGACRDDLDTVRTDTQLDDTEVPAAGDGFFYVITAESVGGDEGTLGFATAAERSNFNACP